MNNSNFIKRWRDEVRLHIKMRYGDSLSEKKIEKLIDLYIEKRLNDRRIMLVNNYTNKVVKLTVTSLIDVIEERRLICSGAGCLFLPHDAKHNLLTDFIKYIMESRKGAKKMMKSYKKFTDEWHYYNRSQNAFKLIINSLYGCLGYPGFALFNIFLAESITTQGRHIITTAINAVEGFDGDSMYYENMNDVYLFIRNVHNEYERKLNNLDINDTGLALLSENLDDKNLSILVVDRIRSKTMFALNDDQKETIYNSIKDLSKLELLMLYYKNNLIEFCNNKIIKDKIGSFIDENGSLMTCEEYSFKNESSIGIMNGIWELVDTFVHYNYPIYDRLRKAMYIDKNAALYTDTDSVFISLDKFVKYVRGDVVANRAISLDEKELQMTSANICLVLTNKMINHAMFTLCKSMLIADEPAKALGMKNEFFMSRIMFFNTKKRYISLTLLQEGVVLGDGEGIPDIKGLDFIKAGTKPTVREFYVDLVTSDILKAKKIQPALIYKKIIDFRKFMNNEILSGNSEFYKQASVKIIEAYKNPFSTQGVKSILLWNALCPEHEIGFPTDVNIVPIKELTYSAPPKSKDGGVRAYTKVPLDIKMVSKFNDKFPAKYKLLYQDIYSNTNPNIKHMSLTSIAIPKTIDYDIPEHIKYLIDTDSIVNGNVTLILPVMKSLGFVAQRISSTEERLSNIVEI